MAKKIVTVADVTVATAGSRQQVTSTSTPCESIIFQGFPTNTGYIYVGDSVVASGRGIALEAKQTFTAAPEKLDDGGSNLLDLSDFYVDSSVNGEKVKICYVTRK